MVEVTMTESAVQQPNGTTERVETVVSTNGDSMEMDQVSTAIEAASDENTGKP